MYYPKNITVLVTLLMNIIHGGGAQNKLGVPRSSKSKDIRSLIQSKTNVEKSSICFLQTPGKHHPGNLRVSKSKGTRRGFTIITKSCTPPMDVDTVVTFEPDFPCSKMKSAPGNPVNEIPGFGERDTKIMFGTDAKQGEFPFLVYISRGTKENKNLYCSGSIATKHHIITAGHCVRWAHSMYMLIGHPNKKKATKIPESWITSLVKHPEYSKQDKRDDYGVVILRRLITFVPGKIEPICLFLGDIRYWDLERSEFSYKTMVIGWGKTEFDPCTGLHKPQIARKRWVITTNCPDTKCFPSHVCIKETYGGTCTGDSGGPILGHEKSLGAWVQVGITSYLKRKKKRIECSGDTVSFKGTFFHFIKPGLNSKIGNPWCDFFTKHIPYEAHLVKGRVHPSVFCEDPDKRFDWCDFPHPNKKTFSSSEEMAACFMKAFNQTETIDSRRYMHK